MKYLIIVALLLRLPTIAQETATPACKLIRETDPYTKETKISTGFIFLDGGSVTIDADSKEIIVLFSIEGADRCFDNNTTADLYFEGIKAKTMGRNGGTMNCEGLFQFVFKNSHSTPTTVLQRILTKKTTQIIFNSNSKKPVTVTIPPKEQEVLMALANCLVTEAKSLVK